MIDCIWTQEIGTEGCGFPKLKQFNIYQGHGILFSQTLSFFHLIRVENRIERKTWKIDRKLSLLQR